MKHFEKLKFVFLKRIFTVQLYSKVDLYFLKRKYPAILFFEYFKNIPRESSFFKKRFSRFSISLSFSFEKEKVRQSYFEEKKQTKQLKSQDKKTPPIIRSFIFSYFSAQSVVDFCLRRRCYVDNV